MATRSSIRGQADEQAEKFVEAIRRMKAHGAYDGYVKLHAECVAKTYRDFGNPTDRSVACHGPSMLPWNRAFLWRFERDAQKALGDETFGLPYWDWTERDDAGSFHGVGWPEDVLGGDGSAQSQRTVAGLPFEGRGGEEPWTIVDKLGKPAGQLQRCLGGGDRDATPVVLPDQATVAQAMNETKYDAAPWNYTSREGFRPAVEALLQQVHRWIGGTMLTSVSPNDPAFYLVHCNLDRLWARWQSQAGRSYVPPGQAPRGHASSDDLYPWLRELRIEEVLDHDDLGYAYDL